MLTDPYGALEIHPNATLQEIKKAYRRLAMLYHPDKAKNDPQAVAKYSQIKDAYEVLTNPVKKENYLQQRWYDQSIGKKTTEIITPASILKLFLELEKHVSMLDVHRMNKEGLRNYIGELLSPDTIVTLKWYKETEINRQIISMAIMAMKPLEPNPANPLLLRLDQLADDDGTALERIQSFRRQQRKIFLWKRYQILVIVILTSLICFLIYLTSK